MEKTCNLTITPNYVQMCMSMYTFEIALAGLLSDYMSYPESLLGGADPCKDLDSTLDHFKF